MGSTLKVHCSTGGYCSSLTGVELTGNIRVCEAMVVMAI